MWGGGKEKKERIRKTKRERLRKAGYYVKRDRKEGKYRDCKDECSIKRGM